MTNLTRTETIGRKSGLKDRNTEGNIVFYEHQRTLMMEVF